MANVFHSGEREVQIQTGEAHIAASLQDLITPYLHSGAVNFIERQPMVIAGSRNAAGEPWASLLTGSPGFAEVQDAGAIVLDTRQITSTDNDVFFSNLNSDGEIGSLFIELSTRKRLRVNGVAKYQGPLIEFTIKQAYPNCPKYIQRRSASLPEYFKKVISIIEEGTALTATLIDWIKNADTLFVASTGADGSMDASHRGGNKGFIQIIDNNVLKVPDYPGNSMFNTFGNITQNPKVGLLFIDFEKRQTLQLTGSATLLFDQTSEADLRRTKGTGRYWLFETSRWLKVIDHHRIEWAFLEYSPFNP
jgi:uncharacterized protein